MPHTEPEPPELARLFSGDLALVIAHGIVDHKRNNKGLQDNHNVSSAEISITSDERHGYPGVGMHMHAGHRVPASASVGLRASTSLPSWGFHLYPHFFISTSAPSRLFVSILHLASCRSHLLHPVDSARTLDFRAAGIFHLVQLVYLIASSGHISTFEQVSVPSHLPRFHLEDKIKKWGSPSSSTGAGPQDGKYPEVPKKLSLQNSCHSEGASRNIHLVTLVLILCSMAYWS